MTVTLPRTTACLLILSTLGVMGHPAFADPTLEKEIKKYLMEGILKTAIEYKLGSFAQSISDTECAYYAEIADVDLDSVAEGLSIEEVKAMSESAGEPIFVEEFIARHDEYNGKETSAIAAAQIVIEVKQACTVVADAIVLSIGG